MEKQIEIQEIMKKLAKLQADVDSVKEYIEDVTLTNDDIISLENAERELREDKLVSLEDIKKKRKKNAWVNNSSIYKVNYKENLIVVAKIDKRDKVYD